MRRESERKRLIADLAKSREDHAINLLSSDDGIVSSDDIQDLQTDNRSLNKGLSSINTIDPQGLSLSIVFMIFIYRTSKIMLKK